MLDLSAANLWMEIEAAIQFRDSHLAQVDDLVDFYTGPAYHSGGQSWSENHMFEYIRLNTSKIVFDNPKTRVTTSRRSQTEIAKALQHGSNRNSRETGLRKLLKNVFVSQCFAFDAVQTVAEPQPWMDPRTGETYHWPMSYQIDRNRFFFDPLCRVFGHARYVGHMWVRDKDDVLREAETDSTWNKKALQDVAADAGTEDLPERRTGGRSNLSRKEILAYELWIPEVELDDPAKGYNGGLYTIALGSGSQGEDTEAYEIREPRPYYGPRWGPYTMFGVYPVPGDPYPLAPFVVNFPQMAELNDIVTSANEAIRKYKKLILCSSENPDLVKKVKAGSNLFVFPVKGFKKDQVIELEIGGITPQHVEQMKQALDRMDRNSGISETHRGNVGSRSTATEIAVADEASKGSISYVQQEFTDATVQMLKTRLWYMYHDDRIKFPLGLEASDEMGMGEAWFQGGGGGDKEYAFDDLELEIEPYSMERMNEALSRAAYREQMELAITAAPLIPNTPYYDWAKLFEKGGDVNNDPYFGEFFLPEIAQMMGIQASQPDNVGSIQSGIPDGIGSTQPAPKPGQQTGAQQSSIMQPV